MEGKSSLLVCQYLFVSLAGVDLIVQFEPRQIIVYDKTGIDKCNPIRRLDREPPIVELDKVKVFILLWRVAPPVIDMRDIEKILSSVDHIIDFSLHPHSSQMWACNRREVV